MLYITYWLLGNVAVIRITAKMWCHDKIRTLYHQHSLGWSRCLFFAFVKFAVLTHWGRVTHICVSKLTIIGPHNGLSPDRRQAIIWTNAGILLIGPLGTNFSEILIEILTFSFEKSSLKVSSAKRRPFCLGLNVLMHALKQSCDYPRVNYATRTIW